MGSQQRILCHVTQNVIIEGTSLRRYAEMRRIKGKRNTEILKVKDVTNCRKFHPSEVIFGVSFIYCTSLWKR